MLVPGARRADGAVRVLGRHGTTLFPIKKQARVVPGVPGQQRTVALKGER